MPKEDLPRSPLEGEFVVADADYFATRARQCRRLARTANDGKAATTLESLADAFEVKARQLRSH
jgi:hypothetical protein